METLDIGIITNHLDKGNGIDTAVARFAEALSKKNNVTLISSRNSFDTDVTFFKLKQDYSKIPVAHKILDKLQLDVISSHFVPSNFIASRTRFFHVMHDPGIPDLYLMRNIKDLSFWAYVNFLTYLSLKRVDIVFSLSEYLKNELIRKYNYTNDIYILPYGIEVPVTWNMIDEKFILFLGRHVKYKNIHTLFKIFNKFSKDHPDIYLYTIGIHPDNDYFKKLLKLSHNKNNRKIKMLGYSEQANDYLASCSAYVTASLWEGQDLPVIEAQMLGRPAITFDNCSHPETNLSGYLAKNDEDFVQQISRAIGKKIDPSFVIEKFSMDKMVKDFETIVRKKINQG